MSLYQLREPIEGMARQGKVIWGTCAGMIMMAHDITEGDPVPLGLMDIGVLRNAFGRQVDSFEEDLQVSVFDSVPFHGVFIRAPAIIRVGQESEGTVHTARCFPGLMVGLSQFSRVTCWLQLFILSSPTIRDSISTFSTLSQPGGRLFTQ